MQNRDDTAARGVITTAGFILLLVVLIALEALM